MLSHFNYSRLFTITHFELARLFASKRGITVLSAFACVWFLIFYYVIASSAEYISSEGFKEIVQQGFGRLNLLTLLEWELPELSVFWLISAYILPFFALLLSSDQTCSDRERGTLRFVLLRSSRQELLYGRFLGQLMIISILILITLIASLLFSFFNQQTITLASINVSFIILLKLILISMPFIASMSLINVFVKSAKMSLVIYLLMYVGIATLINVVSAVLVDVSFLFAVLPGEQIKAVVGFEGNALNNYFFPLIQTIVYLAIAQYLFRKASI